jgi:hypothetical protein
MNAKIITGLSHTAVADGDHFEPHGTLQHVAHFPHPGVICRMSLGAAGLQYIRGKTTAVLKMEDLIKLFEAAHPPFAEKPNGNTTPSEVDELGAGKK